MRIAIVIVLVGACGKGDSTKHETEGVGQDCPLPLPKNAQGRFAVGVKPTPPPGCTSFVVDEKVVTATDGPKLIGEGVFLATCPGQPNVTLVAVAPASLRTQPTLELDSNKPGVRGKLSVQLLDRCGSALVGNSTDATTWTANGCESVATIVPIAGNANASEIEVAPITKGSCTINAAQLGLVASSKVTVKQARLPGRRSTVPRVARTLVGPWNELTELPCEEEGSAVLAVLKRERAWHPHRQRV
jgi:hypothetical protein